MFNQIFDFPRPKAIIGVTADEDDKFVLNNVPVGRHTVQATFVGYEPGIYREILITSAKEVYLEIIYNNPKLSFLVFSI